MTLLTDLIARRVLFFGGKGGVGKSTMATAAALHSAEQGFKTLLVSTDPAHSTSDVLNIDPASVPTAVVDKLDLLEIDPAREVDDYIETVRGNIKKSTPPRLIDEVNRQLDGARLSPGAEESALFDRITRILEAKTSAYHRLIFDTAPTGHTIRLLSLPETMTAWIAGLIHNRKKVNAVAKMWRNATGGSKSAGTDSSDPVLEALEERKERFQRAREVLTDAEQTCFVFTVIPERLPILETERAVVALDKYNIPIGGIIINRVLPDVSDDGFLAERRRREGPYLDEIRSKLGTHRMETVPLLSGDIIGLDRLRQVIGFLSVAGNRNEIA